MKKILFISHSSEPTGAPLTVYQIVSRLSKDKYETITIFPTEGRLIDYWKSKGLKYHIIYNPEISFSEISILKIPWLILRRICFFISLLVYLARENFDLVFVNSAVNVLSGFASFLLRKKVIWHIQETLPKTLKNRIKGFLIKWISDEIVLDSPTCKTILPNIFKHKNIQVIYNAVEIEKFKFKASKEEFAREIGLSINDKIILFVGFLHKRKGVDILIKSAFEILKHRKDVSFILVGEASESSKKFAKNIKDEVKSNNAEKKIFFPGFRDDIYKWLSIADIFVLPSRNESCPISLIEAMAAGKPIIATPVGCVEELLDYGKAGILVPVESEEELTRAIENLLDDEEKLKIISQNAGKRAEELFSMDKFINAFESIFEKVCSL